MEAKQIQVINRALDIIEQLSTSKSGLNLKELSRRTDLPKSTIFRILNTFASRHYIQKNEESGQYLLGYKFVEIASVYLSSIMLRTESEPVMHQIASHFQASCYLGIYENDEVMYLERVDPYNNIRLYTQIGKRAPLYCTSLGKVLLSGLSSETFEKVLKRLNFERKTANTITDPDELRREIEFVRLNRYATDHTEHEVTDYCLGVPIYDYTGKIIAALSVSSDKLFESFKIEEIVQRMTTAAEIISQRMGYSRASQLIQ